MRKVGARAPTIPMIIDSSISTVRSSLVLFAIYFVVTYRYIIRRDLVFSFFYLLLFAYTFFTELAYLYYPDTLSLLNVPLGSPSDWEAYQWFVRGSFATTFVLFVLLYSTRRSKPRPVVRQTPNYALFVWLVTIFDFVLFALFFSTQQTLSYDQQSGLKENGLFRSMFVFANVLVLVIYAVQRVQPSRRRQTRILLSITVLAILLIGAKAGSRGALLVLPIGFLTFVLMTRRGRKQGIQFWLKVGTVGVAVGYLGLGLQIVRRGSSTTPVTYLAAIARPTELRQDYLFSPLGLVFQDYTGPSLLLLYSIQHHLVNTGAAMRSVVLGAVPMSRVPSLGSDVARVISPNLEYTWQGYGYYYLNEGFAVMGWWGIFYNGFVLVGGYWFWRSLFIQVADKNLRGLLGAVAAMQAIDVVRGQSSTFGRAVIFAIGPAIILYYLASGVMPSYSRRWKVARISKLEGTA